MSFPPEAAELAQLELGIHLPSPLRDRCVVVQHVEWKFESDVGIEVQHNDSMPPIWGVIVLVGAQVIEVEYGDYVRFRRHSGEEMTRKGYELFLHHINDIEAIITPEEVVFDEHL